MKRGLFRVQICDSNPCMHSVLLFQFPASLFEGIGRIRDGFDPIAPKSVLGKYLGFLVVFSTNLEGKFMNFGTEIKLCKSWKPFVDFSEAPAPVIGSRRLSSL